MLIPDVNLKTFEYIVRTLAAHGFQFTTNMRYVWRKIDVRERRTGSVGQYREEQAIGDQLCARF